MAEERAKELGLLPENTEASKNQETPEGTEDSAESGKSGKDQ
jgi:hypothetical protein